MLSCEGTGKNIEQAVNNALLELKAAREDVDIKILNEGGFLKKAKVLVSISEDAKEKYAKREAFKKAEAEKEKDFVDIFIKEKVEMSEPAKEKVKIITDEEYIKVDKPSKEAESQTIKETQNEEKAKKNIVRSEKIVDPEKFLKDLLEVLKLEAEISVVEDGKYLRYQLNGENLSDLIGHHGECLFALSSFMSTACRNEDRKKVVLDIANYREKRAEALEALAKRVANQVAKSGRYYKLEPMDASERKIIHTALQEDDRVTTLSKGDEPKRYLIVFPKEYHE